MERKILSITLLCLLLLSFTPSSGNPPRPKDPPGDPYVLAQMVGVNRMLAERGLPIAVEEVELYTLGGGRPTTRIHQQPFRWVAGDARRLAQGDDITYLVDQSDGATTSGLTSGQTEAAIDTALATWSTERCLSSVAVVKRADPGADPDIYDSFFGFGGFGDWLLADIVDAGWMPRAFFEAVGGPGGGRGIVAFSVSYVFIDEEGNPTDVNGDNRLDTALSEVYFNDTFGDPADDRATDPWTTDGGPSAVDVETAALHENGHSLGLGHFGPPPIAVMNPVYAGVQRDPLATDHAGMCAVWESWPK